MNYKAVVFDLDGTLIDSVADLGNAVNRVLSANGFPTHELRMYRSFIGDGAEMMVRRALPEDKRENNILSNCLEQFMIDYNQNFNVDTKLYDGIPELLDYLINKGLKIAILTNKPYEITLKFVKELLSDWMFALVVGNKDNLPRKPDPSGAFLISRKLHIPTQQFVYLGDSGIDMKTATSAGMLPIGVLWGFRDRDELIESGARFLINKPLDVVDLIDP